MNKVVFTNETNELEINAAEALSTFIATLTKSKSIKYIISKVEGVAITEANEEDVLCTLNILRNLTFRGYTHIAL